MHLLDSIYTGVFVSSVSSASVSRGRNPIPGRVTNPGIGLFNESFIVDMYTTST